jgi:hypothetical protein
MAVAIPARVQVKRLRAVLLEVVLATLPLAAGCNTVGTPLDSCIEHHSDSLDTADPSPSLPLRYKIESCRADVDTCIELCSAMMTNAKLTGDLTGCAVTFEGDEVHAAVAYDVMTATCQSSTGRRPDGLVPARCLPAGNALGAWFAHTAWLEASSIYAFLHLARELADFEAPRALVRLAQASARDEVRHTALMTGLARRFGGEPPAVEIARHAPRSLEALAIENAVEGCVRETWGAVVALWQAQRAPDAEMRAAFALIARDEVRHAALGWAIDRWAMGRLDHGARVRVALAREAAVNALAAEAVDELPAIGLPGTADMRRLHAQTYRSLWQGGLS